MIARDALQTALRQQVAAIANIGLYGPAHPQVSHLIDQALDALEKAFGPESELKLLTLDDDVVVDGAPLEQALYIRRFGRTLHERGVGHIQLSQGVTRDELTAFLVRLARPASGGDGLRSTPHIRLGRAEIRATMAGDAPDEPLPTNVAEAIACLGDLRDEEASRVLEVFDTVRRNGRISVSGIGEVVSEYVKVFLNNADPLMALAPLRALDEYTFTHASDVCVINLAQATALGIRGSTLHDIGIAGMLHDVGKMFLPKDILQKPSALSADEWDLMQLHPVKGAHYLLTCPGIPSLATITAFEHHMRHDLTGYPQVRGAWSLNLCSEITMVSDTYDAIRSKRSYQNNLNTTDAIKILHQNAGGSLNPALVNNFCRILQKMKGLERLSN